MARPAARKALDSILLEQRSFPPPAGFAERAHPNAAELAALHAEADADPNGFWARQAREHLWWDTPFRHVLDESDAPNYRWFADGTLNVAANCLDVHLHSRGAHPAIIFEAERGETRTLSYSELHAEVCRFANALKSLGIGMGDRVVIYLPLVPEAVVAMLACARIGAIHSVVFGGFSALSLRDRIDDAGARLLITADGGWRAGNVVELKAAADKALSGGGASIERVIVLRRTGEPVPMESGRDLWWHELIEAVGEECEPVPVPAEHPLYLLYTSGSTGKPKGIQHSSAGYLLGAKLTTRWVFDLKPDDVFWCTADVGWVTGHSYVVYGPLANGATVVLYEGAPTWPDPGRFWQIIERHKVTVFYTAPTAIRALMKLGDEIPDRHDLSSLRLLGSVGEPINPEAWMWYHRVIGGERCPVVDTWWQTETGAIMISPVPGVTATKPGSCTLPLPGIAMDIVDDEGHSVTQPDRGGYLVVRRPWPSMLRTIWGDNQRYVDTYWARFQNRFYVAGDGAHRDADGYFWILGRIDDVLNVSGHRIGTMEVESALVAHPRVAEAAVVGKPHEVKGEAIFAYVVCRGTRPTGDTRAFVEELRNWVGEQVGAIAKPDEIRFTEVLPKTRSGKIMRRLLRSVARGEEITQDVSTLENPHIVDQLRGAHEAAPEPARKKAAVKKGVAKKGAARKAPARKAAAGTRAAKPASKKPVARKPAAKKAGAKIPSAKKGSARKGKGKKAAPAKASRKSAARSSAANSRKRRSGAARKVATGKQATRTAPRPGAKRTTTRSTAGRARVSKRATARGRSRGR